MSDSRAPFDVDALLNDLLDEDRQFLRGLALISQANLNHLLTLTLDENASIVRSYTQNLYDYNLPWPQAIFSTEADPQLDRNEILRSRLFRRPDMQTGNTFNFSFRARDYSAADIVSDDEEEVAAEEIVVPCKPPVENITLSKAEQALADACEIPNWMCDPIHYTTMTDPVYLIPSGQVVQRSTYPQLNHQCPITRAAIAGIVSDSFAKYLITEYMKFIEAIKGEGNLTAIKKITADFKTEWEKMLAAITPNPVINTKTGITVKNSDTSEFSTVSKNFFAKNALDELLASVELIGKCKLAVLHEQRLSRVASEASAACALGLFAVAAKPVINQVENVQNVRRNSI